MKIYHCRLPEGNFGDDLNLWLWPRLLAGACDHGADGILFVGIGTVLNAGLPQARLRVVFGSGAGIGAPPPNIKSDAWRIYGVRGPLTAKLLDLDPALVIGDPALLLRILPKPAPEPSGRPAFIPHWATAGLVPWAEICEPLAIDFIDARGAPEHVLPRIASARLVITKSMHGAIVADAFRVPWLPLLSAYHPIPFKWEDWCRTLGIVYQPRPMPQALACDYIKLLFKRAAPRWFCRSGRGFDDSVFAEKRGSWPVHPASVLVARFREEQAGHAAKAQRDSLFRFRAALGNTCRGAGLRWMDDHIKERAGRELRRLSSLEPYLSSNSATQRQMELQQEALARLRRDLLNGLLEPQRPMVGPPHAH